MEDAAFESRHRALLTKAEAALRRLTPAAETRPARLHAAMRHSLDAGGKRLRPVLCLASAEAFDGKADADYAATALECVHTYSLIHDDLPCMDDSDLRRGRPSCHKAFDEATASSRLLVGGQAEDMGGLAAGAHGDRLEFILTGKTAAMIGASFAMGAMAGGAGAADVGRFRRAGLAVGRAFQLVDDLLDLGADAASLGKPTGAYARNDKLTYVGLHGEAATREQIARLTEEAEEELRASDGDVAFLIELTRRMASRRN
ncbi:MAG: polyprenyl synthetase family protein [Opitutia bacterium]